MNIDQRLWRPLGVCLSLTYTHPKMKPGADAFPRL